MSVYGNFQTDFCIGPQCSIDIYNPSNPEQHTKVNAIVDSGAVATCIPELNIQGIGSLVRGEDVYLRDSNNGTKSRETYYIDIRMPGLQPDIKELRVISIPNKQYAVIGRDILNIYKVVLDAPSRQWKLNCNGICDQVFPVEILAGED